MKKRNIVLTLLSVCGVITTFAFVAANTVRTNNARQSVVSTEGFGNSEIALNKDMEEKEELPSYEKEVTKGVAVSVPIPPSEEETEEPAEPVTVTKEEENYVLPVMGGKIVNDFTDTVLVFQETYGDYRTHLGIDIEALENTPVVSVRDGIVTKSEADYEEGYVVEIEHNDGVVSVYKNLSTNEMAPVGKVVSAGETIGAVGTSGIFESHLNPHLHFEILEDNVEMNPVDYLEELQ